MDGIICINKPKGITSFDVVRKLKKILKEKRIGHTGTLDPLATGVMIICIGRATKMVQDLEGKDKDYIAGFELGYKTDTYDLEGAVVASKEFDSIPLETLNEVLELFKGDIKQVPPMYSALKVDGKRLYDLAREGITVERKERDVKITSLYLQAFNGRSGSLFCSVSKGTYIRSLVYDIGETLEVYATLTDLMRTRVGDTPISKCYTLEEVETLCENSNFDFISSVEKYFNYPKLEISNDEQLKYYKNGNSFSYIKDDGYYSIYYNDEFIGLGNVTRNRLQAYKYF